MEVTGKDVFITAIVVGVAIALVMLNDHKEAQAAEHNVLAGHLIKLEENVAEQTYVLTLTQQKREALNLQMPESLRKKLSGAKL